MVWKRLAAASSLGFVLLVAALFAGCTPVPEPPPAYLLQGGGHGTGDGQFVWPSGVAVDALGTVYVTDSYNDRIQKFDSSGEYVAQWGTQGLGTGTTSAPHGNGNVYWPYGVAVDALGIVYVTDTYNDRVPRFLPTGTFIGKWATQNQTFGITADAARNVYVASQYMHRIDKSSHFGGFVNKFGGYGAGSGQFNCPYGLAVDAAGSGYVTETGNNRVQKFSSTGALLTQWGSQGAGNGQFSDPSGIVVDAAGNVYVTEARNNRVQKFSSMGTYLTQWGTQGAGDGQFSHPTGVAVDAEGNVYVVDAWIITSLGPDALKIMTKAREVGITVPFMGGNNFNGLGLMQQAVAAVEGVISGASWHISAQNPGNAAFIQAFRAKYGTDPDHPAAQAYTGAYLIVQAIKNAGSADPIAIRNSLVQLRDVDTVLGKLSITKDREAVHAPIVQQFKNWAYVILQ